MYIAAAPPGVASRRCVHQNPGGGFRPQPLHQEHGRVDSAREPDDVTGRRAAVQLIRPNGCPDPARSSPQVADGPLVAEHRVIRQCLSFKGRTPVGSAVIRININRLMAGLAILI